MPWARYAMTQVIALCSWGSGGVVSPQQVQGTALVVVELRKSGILRYKIQPKNSTSWFSFLVQNEFKRKNHPFDMPNKANDMHVCTNIAKLKSKILKLTLHLYIINIRSATFKTVWMQKPTTRSLDLRYWGWFHPFLGMTTEQQCC